MPVSKPNTGRELVEGRGRALSNVWMLSHECAGIAHAGGLGEAVAGLARTLAADYSRRITVFLPSHGRQLDPRLREAYHLEEETKFIAQGHRTGVNHLTYRFLSAIERGIRDNVDYVLVKGLDPQTSRWLDNPVLYDHEITFEKMALFAQTMRLYSEYLISMQQRSELPDLIHAHDWHMVPAGVAVKQHLHERGLTVPLVFSVHLLSHTILPWHYASEQWCGIRDLRQTIRLPKNKVSTLTYRQVWEKLSQNSLERFGCYEADYVTSVSESYLTHDVLDYVGDVIKGKSGHIYNGCDWHPDTIRAEVLAESTQPSKGLELERSANRWDLRKLLLTRDITQVNPEGSTLDERSSLTSGNDHGIVEPFPTDGPLVLMTGRLSPQKGPDLLLDAVPIVAKVVPTVKFLLFLLASGDTVQMNTIKETASVYPDNVRIIFAKHAQTYMMAHIAADVYAMPSRSEPFGISALEAMVTGNPVVGTEIGGIRETVLDISSHGDSGTGILFPAEDTRALADSLISLILVMQIDEHLQRGNDDQNDLAPKISIKALREMVIRNPTLGSRLRENCRTQVEQNFRWKNAGRMALSRYNAAINLIGGFPRPVRGLHG